MWSGVSSSRKIGVTCVSLIDLRFHDAVSSQDMGKEHLRGWGAWAQAARDADSAVLLPRGSLCSWSRPTPLHPLWGYASGTRSYRLMGVTVLGGAHTKLTKH